MIKGYLAACECVWYVAQYTSFRGLVALGFGGVGSARVAGFNSTDAARYTALADAYDTPETLKVNQGSQDAPILLIILMTVKN